MLITSQCSEGLLLLQKLLPETLQPCYHRDHIPCCFWETSHPRGHNRMQGCLSRGHASKERMTGTLKLEEEFNPERTNRVCLDKPQDTPGMKMFGRMNEGPFVLVVAWREMLYQMHRRHVRPSEPNQMQGETSYCSSVWPMMTHRCPTSPNWLHGNWLLKLAKQGEERDGKGCF